MNLNEYRVLVTGYRGFVGTETMKYLQEQGIYAVGYDAIDGGYDIRNLPKLQEVVQQNQINRILHLAAVARFKDADNDPILAQDVNSFGTSIVAGLSNNHFIPIIYASTGSVYMPITQEPPITEEFSAYGNSQYACTKRQGELYVMRSRAPWIVLRYAHLYGREKRMHGLIGGYLSRIQFGMEPELMGGKQSNDFCYVKDVARANFLALTAPADKWRQIYNIGTGEELSAEEAGDMVIKAYNKANPAFPFTGKVKKLEARSVDPSRFVYDISKAEKMLKFRAE